MSDMFPVLTKQLDIMRLNGLTELSCMFFSIDRKNRKLQFGWVAKKKYVQLSKLKYLYLF
jgi:hypothetical protein